MASNNLHYLVPIKHGDKTSSGNVVGLHAMQVELVNYRM